MALDKYQDVKASEDDYSHEKKLGYEGRWDLEHGHKGWAGKDFAHAWALKRDAHYDRESRKGSPATMQGHSESAKQEDYNLLHDNPVAKHASGSFVSKHMKK